MSWEICNFTAMEEVLYRIITPGEGFIREKGSKFHGYAYPFWHLDELDTHMGELKKVHFSARHHCFAYRLGAKGERAFATDDREPAHSAGTPILGAIRSASLTDTLIVVVRYFGGTKLGVRGLIEAYRAAAEDALSSCQREAIIPSITFTIDFTYGQTSEVNQVLHRFPVEVIDASYTDVCKQTLSVEEKKFPELNVMLEAIPVRVQPISIPDV